MNKKTLKVIFIILGILTLGIFTACTGGAGGAVCYYGCPNSKRVNKLNTKKSSKPYSRKYFTIR